MKSLQKEQNSTNLLPQSAGINMKSPQSESTPMRLTLKFSIFQIISEKSDTEWKFSRTKLWISFFETGSTVPPPFNIMPTPKDVCRLFGCNKKTEPDKHKEREVAEKRYRDVMKCIIR